MKDYFTRHITPFTFLNITQFLGALNDNFYKLLLVYFLIELQGKENSAQILSLTGAIFVLPFLLFSAFSGMLADRLSKRNIIVFTKALELFIMFTGVLAFTFESVYLSYAILFLMATQSALFGPSKYGIIPELVETDKISTANGLLSSFTYLAVIVGTFLASFLTDLTNRNFIFSALICCAISIVGLLTSLCIEYTPPASDTERRLHLRFWYTIYESLCIAAKRPSLLAAVLGSAFFLYLGGFYQLNMIPFAVNSLGLSDVKGGYLFLLTALGIGTGSVIAGKISGKGVELGLVPIGGIGMIICCWFLDYFTPNVSAVIPFIILVGAFGGIFTVPLDAFIQYASPKEYRGQIIASASFLSFIGVLLASATLFFFSEVLQVSPDKGFTLISIITLVVTIIISIRFYDYITRFTGLVLSRLFFKVKVVGSENIPLTPSIFIIHHTNWDDTLLLLGSQRNRIRFFMEKKQNQTLFLRLLYSLLRVVFIPPVKTLEQDSKFSLEIKKALKRGISLCIFVDTFDIPKKIEDLKKTSPIKELLEKNGFHFVPVNISVQQKPKKLFRNPATVSFNLPIK